MKDLREIINKCRLITKEVMGAPLALRTTLKTFRLKVYDVYKQLKIYVHDLRLIADTRSEVLWLKYHVRHLSMVMVLAKQLALRARYPYALDLKAIDGTPHLTLVISDATSTGWFTWGVSEWGYASWK